MLTPTDVLAYLDRHSVYYTLYHHPAVFSEHDLVEFPKMQGVVLKNLVLTNKRHELYLFTLPLYARADLNGLASEVGSPRFSFAGRGDLAFIGVPAGMVSPLALLNDPGQQVKFFIPKSLLSYPLVNCHPLLNTMSIDIALQDILAIAAASGHEAGLAEHGLKEA